MCPKSQLNTNQHHNLDLLNQPMKLQRRLLIRNHPHHLLSSNILLQNQQTTTGHLQNQPTIMDLHQNRHTENQSHPSPSPRNQCMIHPSLNILPSLTMAHPRSLCKDMDHPRINKAMLHPSLHMENLSQPMDHQNQTMVHPHPKKKSHKAMVHFNLAMVHPLKLRLTRPLNQLSQNTNLQQKGLSTKNLPRWQTLTAHPSLQRQSTQLMLQRLYTLVHPSP